MKRVKRNDKDSAKRKWLQNTTKNRITKGRQNARKAKKDHKGEMQERKENRTQKETLKNKEIEMQHKENVTVEPYKRRRKGTQ